MLTEESKVKARGHLGYLGVAESATFSLGIPAGVQTQFVVEGAFQRLLPQSEPEFYRLIKILDEHECQILENMPNVAVDAIGTIKINPKAFRQFVEQYRYWVRKLANLLGIAPNPFDQRFSGYLTGGGGVNVSVS